MYRYHSFLIHSSADGHLGCFQVLAIINTRGRLGFPGPTQGEGWDPRRNSRMPPQLEKNHVVPTAWHLCDPMNRSPPSSFVHGILQSRILEWVAISFSNCFRLTLFKMAIITTNLIGKKDILLFALLLLLHGTLKWLNFWNILSSHTSLKMLSALKILAFCYKAPYCIYSNDVGHLWNKLSFFNVHWRERRKCRRFIMLMIIYTND